MKSLDQLRRDAKALKKAYDWGDATARRRVQLHPPRPEGTPLGLADFLHVVAQEQSFASWPQLKFAVEAEGLDRAQQIQRLKIALYNGQNWAVDRLLAQSPDLADGAFGLQVALLNRDAVAAMLKADPSLATTPLGPRRPILHLAFSKRIHARPDLEGDMIAVADALLDHGADVNDSVPVAPGNDHSLSALYGAIGHANNMPLARWFLEHGADPNDGESLYHATELGHHEGLRLLLEHGADPKGTNALLRAMDFDDVTAVRMLIDAGARVDDFDDTHVGGEAPWVVPALHQAARRMSGPAMIDLLLDAGADMSRLYQGQTAYGYARVFGNDALSKALTAQGANPALTEAETFLAQAAECDVPTGTFIDPAKLPDAYRNMLRVILHLPGKLPHIKRLVAMGLEYDLPDAEGLTPVQVAGWEGLPEVMEYFLSLKPDLGHINGYGGTLLSTIVHGSENNPDAQSRDHLRCLEMVLELGVVLPQRAIETAGRADVQALLADWAAAHPGQRVDHGG